MESKEFVYLLHFEKPISAKHTSQHYLGTTNDLDKRIREHRRGTGKRASRFCAVAKERGISFTLAEVIPGGIATEKKLKKQKNARRICPICKRLGKQMYHVS